MSVPVRCGRGRAPTAIAALQTATAMRLLAVGEAAASGLRPTSIA